MPTPKTPAERQKTYREKAIRNDDKRRLNLLVDYRAKLSLERLALRYAVTQQDMLERIIGEYEEKLTQTFTDDELEAYFQKNLIKHQQKRERRAAKVTQ